MVAWGKCGLKSDVIEVCTDLLQTDNYKIAFPEETAQWMLSCRMYCLRIVKTYKV